MCAHAARQLKKHELAAEIVILQGDKVIQSNRIGLKNSVAT